MYRFLSYFFILLGLSLGSCVSTKKTTYFTDIPHDERSVRQVAAYTDPVIQPDDILSITVQTIDPASSVAINQGFSMEMQGRGIGGGGMRQIEGFLVDQEGKVSLAMLGDIPVAGLTTTQAKERIQEYAAKQYKNPTVQVRFANYKVTVLGEVSQPATYTLPNEKVGLLDALGMAGDLTIFGKRENVLLIRDLNGQKEFIRFDLNSSDIFSSPYYYLKQNDVIYVEASRGRAAANNVATMQTISIVSTIVTLGVLLFTRLR